MNIKYLIVSVVAIGSYIMIKNYIGKKIKLLCPNNIQYGYQEDFNI